VSLRRGTARPWRRSNQTQTLHSSAVLPNEVLDLQSAQGQTRGQLLDPINGGDALLWSYSLLHGHEPGHGCPVFGDRDFLTRLNLFQEFRQIGFCLVGADRVAVLERGHKSSLVRRV